jgi:hypothetical protein
MIEYEDSQNKAAILLEALPYVRRFRGSVFVVKYGGSFMDSPDPAVRSRVAQDLVFLNFRGNPSGGGSWRRQGGDQRIGKPWIGSHLH